MQFQENVPLAQYGNYNIGGPAKYFVEVRNEKELQEALVQANSLNEKIFILGGGNNLLISDKGFNGVVIRLLIGGIELQKDGNILVGAGTLVRDFLTFTTLYSLSSWAWAGGLPGTIGGAIWGNAGAFGGETKDSVVNVVSMDLQGKRIERNANQCNFGYRTSIFKEQEQRGVKEIIVSATFKLSAGKRDEIEKEIQEHILYRKTRQPIEQPNIGSMFKNIPVDKVPKDTLERFKSVIKNDPFPILPVAALTSEAGLKEYRVGDAMVSPKHPNFIVNLGKATSNDVKAVMEQIKKVNKEKFGVDLEQEVIFVGED
jgi:UDP-N-acetylmuramate dehydrogenase